MFFLLQHVSQTLSFLIPALDLVTDHSNSGEEVSHEQNEEAETTHHDLALRDEYMSKHKRFNSSSFFLFYEWGTGEEEAHL